MKHLAGKTAQFAITVKKVEEPVLPEVDDEFVKAFGVGEGTSSPSRPKSGATWSASCLIDCGLRQRKRSWTSCESNSLELPNALVDDEAGRLLGSVLKAASARVRTRISWPNTGDVRRASPETCGSRTPAAEIIRTHELSADPDKVREVVDSIASPSSNRQVVSYYYSDRSRLAEIESSVLEDQVVDLLLERAQVTEEQRSFDDLMNPGQAPA